MRYTASAKKIYLRRRFHVEDFGEECDVGGYPWEVHEPQLLIMTPVLARDLFAWLMEGYHDYVQAKISLCPDTERKGCVRALELIDEARTLMLNRNGTQEEAESGLKKLRTSTLVLPWGHVVFTEEEMRVQDEEIHRMVSRKRRVSSAVGEDTVLSPRLLPQEDGPLFVVRSLPAVSTSSSTGWWFPVKRRRKRMVAVHHVDKAPVEQSDCRHSNRHELVYELETIIT
ncbi:hypothetical protein ARMGADRAFT_1143825 [Armillaria gallica]|uniref:Uncharacterized protein n=1 Tax=Armillaria gallica TaxID=47427 RepID=A0A2H3D0K0_ARMGA|nr:hypothetical protein ARMGADRAFT_1143825 [Armillaria gallica]